MRMEAPGIENCFQTVEIWLERSNKQRLTIFLSPFFTKSHLVVVKIAFKQNYIKKEIIKKSIRC